MSQTKFNLSNVRVASPCAQKWEELVGDDRQRFCAHCQLNVYNFSAMTQVEAERFLLKAEGRVCGRFYQRADGTMLTQDCPAGLRAIRQRVSRMGAAAFSALLGLVGISCAQQQPPSETNASIQRSLRRYNQPAIQGTVYDHARAVIPNSTVTAVNPQTKKTFTARSNEEGRFRFVDLPAGTYTIEIDSPGFMKFSYLNVQLVDEEAILVEPMMEIGQVVGNLVILPSPDSTNDEILPMPLSPKAKPRK